MAKPTPSICTVDIQYASEAIAAKLHTIAPKTLIKQWINAAIGRSGEITLRFVNRAEGQALNAQFRGKDYATNVLTFPYQLSKHELVADIVLCLPVIAKEAREQHKTEQAHLAHLIVHGCLHALGYDHERDRQAKAMEGHETAILKNLGFSNPYI